MLRLLRPKCMVVQSLAAIIVVRLVGALSSPQPPLFALQDPYPPRSPAETLREMATACNNVDNDWDVYGDYDKKTDESFLRRFEAEIAEEFEFQDAVFMPSGVMAQSIALLIHANDAAAVSKKEQRGKTHFLCHHSSHLLLYEQEAYRELLNMEAVVVSTIEKTEVNQHGIPIVPPMLFLDVQECLNQWRKQQQQEQRESSSSPANDAFVAAIILEVPHRELGGKMTPWKDMEQMRDYCKDHGMAFHCDGARIFEATTAFNNNDNPRENLRKMAKLFDSMYISFYKGLGGISGAMLLGTNDFCDQARVWLRRFGGNLYTLLPYYVSAWLGYQRQWKIHSIESKEKIPTLSLSFAEKKQKLVRLVAALSADPIIQQVVSFDPPIPETNMVHGYVHQPAHDFSADECRDLCSAVQEETGIRVLTRIRDINVTTATTPNDTDSQPQQLQKCCKFELAMGEANGNIPDEIYLQGWSQLAMAILSKQQKQS